MTFFELNYQDPAGGHDIAEYVDGKVSSSSRKLRPETFLLALDTRLRRIR